MIVDIDTLFGFWPGRRVDLSLDRLLELMAKHGVDAAWTASARGIAYDFLEGNAEAIAAAQQHPRLTPVLTLDPRRYLGAPEEVKQRIAEGHRLFRLYPEYQNWSADAPAARKLLSILENAGAVIMLGGTAAQAIPAILDLSTPVVLTWAHFYSLSDLLAYADELPHVYLSTRFLIGPGSLEIAVGALGAQRLLFGSHAPLVTMGAALGLVQQSELPDDQKAAILGGNAQRLLAMPSSGAGAGAGVTDAHH